MKKINNLLSSLVLIFSLCLIPSCSTDIKGNNVEENDKFEKDERYKLYEMALSSGKFTGTYEEWLDSIKGQNGVDGKSAYELYKDAHPEYTKSEEEWLDDLVNGRLGNVVSHKVSFDEQGGSHVEDQVIPHLYKAKKPEPPHKEGHTFDGWYIDDEKWVFSGYNVTEDITLVAHWIVNEFKVTINFNNGSDSKTVIKKYNDQLVLEDPTKDNADFVGWQTQSGEILHSPITIKDNLSITAKFQEKSLDDKTYYDPYYPQNFEDTPYEFVVPELDERFTLNEDRSIATLFAPGVTSKTGYYDVNKNFRNDNHLCWAAAVSNCVAWYLDRCHEQGYELSGVERDVNRIFDNFRKNWDYMEGYDPMQGFAWYFTGKTMNGSKPPELLVENSGGYLKHFPNVGDQWSILDPQRHYSIVGNYGEQFPFLDENINIDSGTERFYKDIIGQLHYGPSVLMIVNATGSAVGGHAITLWGCDFDTKTGEVKAIYICDSDDESDHPGVNLRRIKIKPESSNHAISMVDYYPSRGLQEPFKYIKGATNLFAPKVVRKKTI